MGRPLDQESRVFGILKITELYILIGVFLLGLMFMPALQKIFRLGIALGLFGTVLLVLFSYFALSSGLPDGFFKNMVFFHNDKQHFYPGPESPKEGKE